MLSSWIGMRPGGGIIRRGPSLVGIPNAQSFHFLRWEVRWFLPMQNLIPGSDCLHDLGCDSCIAAHPRLLVSPRHFRFSGIRAMSGLCLQMVIEE